MKATSKYKIALWILCSFLIVFLLRNTNVWGNDCHGNSIGNILEIESNSRGLCFSSRQMTDIRKLDENVFNKVLYPGINSFVREDGAFLEPLDQNDSPPSPSFGSSFGCSYYYDPFGDCTGYECYQYVWNRGGTGDVYVSVLNSYNQKSFSEVFEMQADELVKVWASGSCPTSWWDPMTYLDWETRAAVEGDVVNHELVVERLECKPDFTASPVEGVAPLTVQFSNTSSVNVGYTTLEWNFGDGSSSTDENPIHTYDTPGTYTVSLRVTCLDGEHLEIKQSFIRVYSEEQSILHVPEDYPTIQEAIDAAHGGTTILVADGIYKGSNGDCVVDFKGKNIIVKSENGPENCIIDGEYKRRGVSFPDQEEERNEHPILDGFTIKNCAPIPNSTDSNTGSGIRCGYYTSPIIKDCILINNEDDYDGGGINCAFASTPKILNCLIVGNKAGYGGGISGSGDSLTVTNCVIAGNTAWDHGGGVYATCYTNLINCTICSNKASSQGGAIFRWAFDLTVTNSILWNDSPQEIYNDSDYEPDISYSDIQGGFPGQGNINEDPLFVGAGDYRLRMSSPCVDSGMNSANSLTKDLLGNPRIIDGDENGTETIDMGAYEFSKACLGDTDGDGDIDGVDLSILQMQFGALNCSLDCRSDLDDDNTIGVLDLGIFAGNFGSVCLK